MSIAKDELIIIDSYADKVILDMISKLKVKVIQVLVPLYGFFFCKKMETSV